MITFRKKLAKYLLFTFMPFWATASTPPDKLPVPTTTADAVVKHIREEYGTTPTLLEVVGICKAHSEVIEIPRFEWSALAKLGGDVYGSPSSISHDRTSIKIQREDGILLIKWPNVSSRLLNLDIGILNLSKVNRYSVVDIMGHLLNKREVYNVMLSLRMRPMVELTSTVPQPSPGGAHLPILISNTSVESILKLIVQEFNGIFFYKECSLPNGQKRMDFKYYGPNRPLQR